MKTHRTSNAKQRVDHRGKRVVSRLPLHEQVAERIRKMIVSGDLEPGAKLKPADLAEEFEVSPTPLREALKVLAQQNLVELTANRGARVSEVSVDGTRSLFEVMSRIEAIAAELAAARITEEELAEIEGLHQRMKAHSEASEIEQYFELNRQIHDLVSLAAKNPDLTRIRNDLSQHVERARFISVATPGHRDKSIEDHEQLMQALRLRDAESAKDIWQRHLERAGEEACRLVTLLERKADTAAQ